MRQSPYSFSAYHVLPDSPQMQQDFLYVIASFLCHSSETFAPEVVRIAQLNAILPVSVQGFQEYPSKGCGGLITLPNEHRPRAILMGTRAFMSESGLDIPAILEATAKSWESEPKTIIWLVGWDSWVRGVLKLTQS
jgi:cation transport ATPase